VFARDFLTEAPLAIQKLYERIMLLDARFLDVGLQLDYLK